MGDGDYIFVCEHWIEHVARNMKVGTKYRIVFLCPIKENVLEFLLGKETWEQGMPKALSANDRDLAILRFALPELQQV